MIPIQILSIYSLAEKMKNKEKLYSLCVSITDPEPPVKNLNYKNFFKKTCRLCFHDIDKLSDMPKQDKPKLVQPRHIKKAVRFYRKNIHNADGFTIHCHAGVHRSSAVGLIYLYLSSCSEQSAADELLRLRPLPMPNRRMILLFDQLYNTDLSIHVENMWQRGRDYLEGKIEIDADDYLEDLMTVDE